jgi:hypothetical protein
MINLQGFEPKQMIGCLTHPLDLASHPKSRGNWQLIANKSAFAIPNKEASEEFIGRFQTRNAVIPTS